MSWKTSKSHNVTFVLFPFQFQYTFPLGDMKKETHRRSGNEIFIFPFFFSFSFPCNHNFSLFSSISPVLVCFHLSTWPYVSVFYVAIFQNFNSPRTRSKKFMKKKLFRLPNTDQMKFVFGWIQLDNDIEAFHIVPTFWQPVSFENLKFCSAKTCNKVNFHEAKRSRKKLLFRFQLF